MKPAASLRSLVRGLELRIARPVRGRVAVSYGHDSLPEPGAAVSGGMAKFQRLQETFPNEPRRFNVLYLGSSTLATDAERLQERAHARGAVVVLNQNGVAYPGWAGERTDRVNARLRGILLRAHHVVYQSEFCKRAADEFLGEPPGTWEVLHNPVDTETYSPGEAPRTAAGPVLLLAGDQLQPYRLPLALATLARVSEVHPDARLLVTGTVVGGLERIAELGLGGRVEILGRYAQRDAPAIYRSADVLLHTKVNDPCPNVVLEALASGLPVVHPASGGTPELVGPAGVAVAHDARWDVDSPPSADAFAAAVVSVLELRDELARTARRRAVERFDLRPWVARHAALFERLTGIAS